MSPRPIRRHPADVFQSFIRELAPTQQRPAMLERLRKGHEADRHGWCSHRLHICRDLLAAEDGAIAIRPVDPDRLGCVVIVELPAAPAATSTSSPFVQDGVRCAAS
jgi:hypothetical protein